MPHAYESSPLFWLELLDAIDGLHVWSQTLLDDAPTYYGGEKDPRLTTVGQIRRALSDRNGNFESAEFTFEVADVDRAIRALLANPTTRFLLYRPVTLRVIEDAERRAELDPITIAKGIITGYTPNGPKFSFTAADALAARFSSSSDQSHVPQRSVLVIDFPTASSDALKKGVPIVYGNVTDTELLTLQSPAGGAFDSTIRTVPNVTVSDNGAGTFTGPVWVSVTAVRAGLEGRGSPAVGFVNPAGGSIRVNFNAVSDATSYRIYFANAADFGPFTGAGTSTQLRFVTHDNATIDGVYGTDYSKVINGWGDGTASTPVGQLPRNLGLPGVPGSSMTAIAGTLAWQFDNPDPAKRPVWLWLVPVKDGYAGPAIALSTAPWTLGDPPDPLTSTGVSVHWNAAGGPPDSYRLYFADAADFDPFGTNGAATKARYVDHDTATHDGSFGFDYDLNVADWTVGTDILTSASTSLVDIGKGAVGYVYVGKTPSYDGVYHTFLIAGHACVGCDEIYVDGVAQGLQTNPAVGGIGGDWIVPGSANWNAHVGGFNQYVDINGRRYFLVYGREGRPGPDIGAMDWKVRGPQGIDVSAVETTDHLPERRSDVALGFSLRGIDTDGDGTGALINGLYDQYRHAMINWVLQSYQAGAWLAAPTFAGSATPLIDTVSFDVAYAASLARYGLPYVGGGVLGQHGERMTARELIRRFNLSCDVECGFNRQFQFFVSFDDPTEAHLLEFDEDAIVPSTFRIWDEFTEHFNNVPYVYAPNALNVWTHDGSSTDQDSIDGYGGPVNTKTSPDVELFFVRDSGAAADIALHRRQRTTNPVRYCVFQIGFDAVKAGLDLSRVVWVTHYEGIGVAGWINHPIRIVRMMLDPEQMRVELVGYDLNYAGEIVEGETVSNPIWLGGGDTLQSSEAGAWIPATDRSAVQVLIDPAELDYSVSSAPSGRRVWLGGGDTVQSAVAGAWITASDRSAVQTVLTPASSEETRTVMVRLRADAGTVKARLRHVPSGTIVGVMDETVASPNYTTKYFDVTLSSADEYAVDLQPSLADTDVSLGSSYLL